MKDVSSRRLRFEYTGEVNRAIMHGRFWPRSYSAASCGGAPTTVVRQYIENRQRPL